MLGAFLALSSGRGLGIELLGWLLPHGVTELLAVLLCAAAGLAVGEALVFPGRSSRLDALARVGRRGGLVVLGGVLLFFLAGLLEGFFRQLVTNDTVRHATWITSAFVWAAYFGFAGRREGEEAGESGTSGEATTPLEATQSLEATTPLEATQSLEAARGLER